MSEQEQEMSDEEVINQIVKTMKDNVPSEEEKHNTHSFLFNVVHTESLDKNKKIANLRNDEVLDELGVPVWTVRGAGEMALISKLIMANEYFTQFFEGSIGDTLATSLSREGFLIRQGTTQTKQVADITRRRKINKGMFGSRKIEETGGDTLQR